MYTYTCTGSHVFGPSSYFRHHIKAQCKHQNWLFAILFNKLLLVISLIKLGSYLISKVRCYCNQTCQQMPEMSAMLGAW